MAGEIVPNTKFPIVTTPKPADIPRGISELPLIDPNPPIAALSLFLLLTNVLLLRWETFSNTTVWLLLIVDGFLGLVTLALMDECVWVPSRQYTDVRLKLDQWTTDLANAQSAVERRCQRIQAEATERAGTAETQLGSAIEWAQELVQRAKEDANRLFVEAGSRRMPAEIDARLRGGMLVQAHTGHFLTVKVLASPTGRIGLEWTLHPDVPQDLEILGFRGEKHIFTVCGAGYHADQLVQGKGYRFLIRAPKFRDKDFAVHRAGSYRGTMGLRCQGRREGKQSRREIGGPEK